MKYTVRVVYFVLVCLSEVGGWLCISQIGKVYSQVNNNPVVWFTANLANLNSPRMFFVKFYDGTPKATVRYNADKSYTTDAVAGVGITADGAGNVSVTLLNVQLNNAGIYILNSAGIPDRCNCLYILGTPTKPSIALNKIPSVGDSATLTCSSTSTTTPSNHSLSLTYNWRVDNVSNPSGSSGSRYFYSNNRNTLKLSSIVKDDANKLFICAATEVVSDGDTSGWSDSFAVGVLYGPENLYFSPVDTIYERAENTRLNPVTCNASCNPTCSFKWTKIGQTGLVSNTASLSLTSLASSDAGIYRCTATRSGSTSQTKDVTVNVIYGPRYMTFTPQRTSHRVNENFNLSPITCYADCWDCSFSWTGPNTYSSFGPVLDIGSMNRTMAGMYICTATNTKLSTQMQQTREVQIEVRYGPDTANISVQSPYNITEGDTNVHIECYSDCYPGCSYAWTNLTSGSRISGNDILSLGTVNRYMTGDYKCTSSNAAAEYRRSSEAKITTIVNYSPDVRIRLSTTNVRENESLTLFCDGSGVPSTYKYTSLTQKWNNIEIPNSNTAEIGTQLFSSIHFSSLKLEDTGTYTCTLNNGVRNTSGYLNQVWSRSILVEVWPKVLIEKLLFTGSTDGTVRIQIPVYSYPALKAVTVTRYDGQHISDDQYNITKQEVRTMFYGKKVSLNGSVLVLFITDLKEKDFGNYTFNLTNNLGTKSVDAFVIAEGPPLPPKVFQFLSGFSIPTFLWEKDFNGGLDQSFVIQISVIDTELWTNHTNISERDNQYKINSSFYMANITGLQPGIYSARIFANNTEGESKTVYVETTFEVHRLTEDPTTSVPTAAIAGGCASAVVVIAIFVVVLVALKRRAENKDGSETKLDAKNYHEENDDDEDEVNTVNPMYISADEVQSVDNTYAQSMKKKNTSDVYAVVDKKKGKGKKEKKTNGKSTVDGDIYENAPASSLKEKINMKKIKNGKGKACDENLYENPQLDQTKQPKKLVNKDGLIYADLAFNDQPKGQKKLVIHGLDSMTEYVEVDFTKKADPLPDSDEEDNKTKT